MRPARGTPGNYPWGKRFVQGSCCRWKRSDLASDACGGCGNCIAKFVVVNVRQTSSVVYCVSEKLRANYLRKNSMMHHYWKLESRGIDLAYFLPRHLWGKARIRRSRRS